MFGKCLKYELRAYSRLLVPTFIAIMAASVLMSVAVGVLTRLVGYQQNELVMAISAILLYFIILAVYLSLFIIPVMVFVLTVRRFYTSFFTDEGYLTFTLPVSVDHHLMSKLLAAAIADIFGVITAILSVVIVASGALIANADVIKNLIGTTTPGMSFEELKMLGVSVVTIIMFIVTAILSVIGNYLLLYLSISLGCMIAKKHRFIVCGACYLGVSTVVSTLSSVVSIVIMFIMTSAMITQIDQLGIIFNAMLGVISVFLAIEVVVCYFITRYILKNKVNLD